MRTARSGAFAALAVLRAPLLTPLRRLLVVLGLPALLFALWWVTTSGSTNVFWPPLSKIVSVFDDTWFHGRLVHDVVPSLIRLVVGYLVALALGVSIGVAVGSVRTLRAIVEPGLEFFRAIPPPVLIPILILFAGIDNTMKVLVIVSGCVWPVLLNTVEGVRSIDEALRDAANSYRFRRRTRLIRLILPAASPQIAAGARQSLSIGIILMVISEMFAASNGIGFTIIGFQRTFAVPQMWTGIILLGIIGIALAFVFHLVESRVLRWYVGLRRSERGRS